MKLHILSDLHLGFGDLEAPDTDADVVILAGDIGRPKDAVKWAYGLRKPVVYVAGNHEFYGSTVEQTLAELRDLTQGTNVHFLDDDELVLDGVRFLGCTLWTDMGLFGNGADRELAVRAAWQTMRDFQRIRVAGGRHFAPDDMVLRSRNHLAWLERRLADPSPLPTVVVTHHAPSRRSIHPQFKGAMINACYINDLERLFGAGRVRLWIHGHTHNSFDYVVQGTRVVCNPRGYQIAGVEQNRQFDPALVVEVGTAACVSRALEFG
jgi:predicted phosphodiesterase